MLSQKSKLFLMPQHAFAGTGQPYLDIEKLKFGDPASFHHLYQLFYSEFVLKAASLLNEKEEAPTLVNHCFIKCWLRCEALTSMDYILAFLSSTTRNNCTACNNSNGFRSVHYSNVLETVLSPAIHNNMTRKELFSIINNLHPEELRRARTAFSRFYGRRLSVTEIAREMGLEPETANNCLNTAFKVLHLILYMENM